MKLYLSSSCRPWNPATTSPTCLLAVLALLLQVCAVQALAETPGRASGFDSLPAALTAARHRIRPVSEGARAMEQNEDALYFAASPSQDFCMRFVHDAVRVQKASGVAGTLRLRGLGYGEMLPPSPAVLHVEGARVEYRRSALTEWYENRVDGLEQGFTVHCRPGEPEPGQPLRVWLTLEGLQAEAPSDSARDELVLRSPDGEARFNYRGLKAWDAQGTELTSYMRATSGDIVLEVDDTEAEYPITIDPLLVSFSPRLLPPAGTGEEDSLFGASVALDGKTAVVGAPNDFTAAAGRSGSAYVFVQPPGEKFWQLQAHLVPSTAHAGAQIGVSVTVDGDSVIVGAPSLEKPPDAGGPVTGGAYVFVRDGDRWHEEALLQPSLDEFRAGDLFGAAVAVSGDRALIGSPGWEVLPTSRRQNRGRVYFYSRSGSRWSLRQQETCYQLHSSIFPILSWQWDFLADQDPFRFGTAVALDGDLALVGAPGFVRFDRPGALFWSTDGTSNGTSYPRIGRVVPYTYEESGYWLRLGSLSIPEPEGTGNEFGSALALNGTQAIVGCRLDDNAHGTDAGSAYVYSYDPVAGGGYSQWSRIASLDAEAYGQADAHFGHCVAIDQGVAVVGAPYEDTPNGAHAGSLHVFYDAGSDWLHNERITGDHEVGHGLGRSVVLDNARIIAGLAGDTTGAGAEAGSAQLYRLDGVDWVHEQALSAGDSPEGDRFGHALAMDEDTLVVGVPEDDTLAGNDAGSAYVFARHGHGWKLQSTLGDLDGAPEDFFGYSVAVQGDLLAIGAIGDDTVSGGDEAGSVVTFARSGTPEFGYAWSQTDRLEPLFSAPYDYFGNALAMDGNTLVVGAELAENTGAPNSGRAHVFTAQPFWTQQAVLEAHVSMTGDRFGSGVAIDGDTVVIGAKGDDGPGGSGAGSATVFTRSGTSWTRRATLTSGETEDHQQFGNAVALDDGTLLVGADADDTTHGNAGSVYVFTGAGSSWSRDARLEASDPAEDGLFGQSLALDGPLALIGAPGAQVDPGSGKVAMGKAYLFLGAGSSWTEELQLFAGLGDAGEDRFGAAVDLEAGRIAIGAPDCDHSSDTYPDSGSVLVGWIAPGMAVYAGSSASYPQLDSGQVNPVTFAAPAGSSQLRTFTIVNTGSTPLEGIDVSLDLSSPDADFVLTAPPPATLAPGETGHFTLSYEPVGAYAFGQALVRASGLSTFEFPIFGKNKSLPKLEPKIAVYEGPSQYYPERTNEQDAPLEFYVAASGPSMRRERILTIRNEGGDLLDDFVFALAGGTCWDISAPSPSPVLFPQRGIQVTIGFEAPPTAYENAELWIASNDIDESPFVVKLFGAVWTDGEMMPELEVYDGPDTNAPVLIDDADEPIRFTGSASIAPIRTFTIANHGHRPLSNLAITLDGSQADAFAASALQTSVLRPGERQSFTVSYTASGPYSSAALHLDSNDLDEQPFDLLLFGYNTDYVKHSPEIRMYAGPDDTAPALSDGQTTPVEIQRDVGAPSGTQIFTVKNTGTDLLENLEVLIDGVHGIDFAASPPGRSLLLPGAATTFSVTCTPPYSSSPREGAIHVVSNDADENPFDFPVVSRGWSVLERWRYYHFGSILNEGDGANEADPDGDDICNITEFGFLLHPWNPNPRGDLPDFLPNGDRSLVQTAFTKPPQVEGVDYGLLVTTDLLTVPFSFRFLPDTDPDPEAYLFATETGTNRCLFATIVVWEVAE